MAHVFYITHPEVVIDPGVPVPDWGLSEHGRARMAAIAALPEMAGVRSVWSSTEQKARDGRDIMAAALGVEAREHAGLGENDRSATGYLPEAEFWPVVEAFFANPDVSARGWETARAAQTRCVSAVRAVLETAPPGDVAIVAHGGVGNLLMCHLKGVAITRSEAAPGMGAWFAYDRDGGGAVPVWIAPPED